MGRESKHSLTDTANSLIRDSNTLCSSLLTEWQNLDALRTFLLPRITHKMDCALVPLKWAERLYQSTRKLPKKALRLPQRATTDSFLHGIS